MKGDTVTVLFLLITIIGIALWISYKSDIKPYSISKYTPYEGYQNINYSDSKNVKALDDSLAAQSTVDVPKCTQLGGWKGFGIFCTPNGGLNQIDIYSQAEGDLECGNSSGYHNSKGGLCLDKTMVNLLQTRGLNATGGNGQIGSGQA